MDGLNWRTASYSGSGGGNCVETASTSGLVLVRDTTQADDPVRLTLSVPADAWTRFTASLR